MADDFRAIRERLQNSVNWMMEGRNTGLCPGVADFQALIRLIDTSAQPVAWAVFAPNGNIRLWSVDGEAVRKFATEQGLMATPLYTGTAPQAQAVQAEEPSKEMNISYVAMLLENGYPPKAAAMQLRDIDRRARTLASASDAAQTDSKLLEQAMEALEMAQRDAGLEAFYAATDDAVAKAIAALRVRLYGERGK